MAQGLNNKIIKRVSCVVALGLLAGCASVGGSTGRDYAPLPFQDEGGISAGVSPTLPGEYLAGRQALRDKDTQAASDFLSAAYSLNKQDNLLLQSAFRAALANGEAAKTRKLAAEIIARDGIDDDMAQLVLAIDDIKATQFSNASQRIEKIKARGFNILLKPVLLAWAQVGEGKFDLAVKTLDDLDKYDGFKLLKPYHLALLAHASGQTELAREQYEKALKGPAGRAIRLVQSYGIFLLEQGEPDKARQLFTDYKKRFPLSPTINRLLEQLDDGESIKPLIANPVEGAAEALYSSASIIGQERAKSAAITFANFALMLRPDLTVANVLLAEIYEGRGQRQKALEYYLKIPRSSPYSLNARIRVAWLTYKLGDEDTAIRSLEKLTEENPAEVEPLIILADLNRDRKDWKSAAAAYGRAIDTIGDVKGRIWSLLYARGIAYERMGQWEKAEADFLRALDIQPNHPQILNYLGYSWADRGEKLEQAKQLLIKAVSLRPRDGYIVDSLGWLYYRVKDYKNATVQLERAVALQPEDPTINDHLGDVYWQVGRQNEARYQWQRALWLEPEADQIPLIERKLQEGLAVGNGSAK